MHVLAILGLVMMAAGALMFAQDLGAADDRSELPPLPAAQVTGALLVLLGIALVGSTAR